MRERDVDGWEPPEKHRAADRFAGGTLRGAQAITDALAQAGVPDDGVVVLDRHAPRRGLAGLERLLDAALDEVGADTEEAGRAGRSREAHGTPPVVDDPGGSGQTGPR